MSLRLVVARSLHFLFGKIRRAGRIAMIIILLSVCYMSYAQDNSPVINAIIEDVVEYVSENEESENVDIDRI